MYAAPVNSALFPTFISEVYYLCDPGLLERWMMWNLWGGPAAKQTSPLPLYKNIMLALPRRQSGSSNKKRDKCDSPKNVPFLACKLMELNPKRPVFKMLTKQLTGNEREIDCAVNSGLSPEAKTLGEWLFKTLVINSFFNPAAHSTCKMEASTKRPIYPKQE